MHGETRSTGKVLPGRAPGLHLAPAGEREAESVAERLAGLPLAACVFYHLSADGGDHRASRLR